MTAKLINGNEIAAQIREEIKQETAQLKEASNVVPGLVTILVGQNPASVSYVTAKQKASRELGFYSLQDNQPPDVAETDLLALIEKYNQDPKIHGILVQLPLPEHINETKILYAIDPRKDVDGFHPVNVGKLMIGAADYLPLHTGRDSAVAHAYGSRNERRRSRRRRPFEHCGQAHRQYPFAETKRG